MESVPAREYVEDPDNPDEDSDSEEEEDPFEKHLFDWIEGRKKGTVTIEDRAWPPKKKVEDFYHIHPAVYNFPSVRRILDSKFGYLRILERIPEEDLEKEEPKNEVE